MKSKIFLIIYIILAAALAYWAYPIIKERYFNQSEEAEKSDSYEIDLDEIEEAKNIQKEDEEEESEKESGECGENEFLEVDNEDCENNCAEFTEESDLRYCRQVCGLTPLKKENSNSCENLTGLEKDYCLKDLAITEKDFNVCRQIKDKNIRETCQNRITEELLE